MQTAIDWTTEEILKSLPTDPDELIAYRCPPDIQHRMNELIALSKAGQLVGEARLEANRLLELEGKISMLKVKALKAKKKSS